MNYNTIITPPVKFGTDVEIPIKTLGSTLFVKLTSKFDTNLYLEEVDTIIPKTPKPHVRFEYMKKGVLATAKEGEPLQIKVVLSEKHNYHTDVKLEVLHTTLGINGEWRKNKLTTDNTSSDPMDFFSETSSADYDITVTQVAVYSQAGESFMQAGDPDAQSTAEGVTVETSPLIITIPAGQTEGVATINTMDDGLMTGGAGTYRVSEVRIIDVENDYMIHHSHKVGFVLVEDATPYPVWGGAKFELWGKLADRGLNILDPEPILDNGTPVVLELGYTSEDGITPKDSLSRAAIIDLTPFDKIYVRCLNDSVITTFDSSDVSAYPPRYSVVVNIGE